VHHIGSHANLRDRFAGYLAGGVGLSAETTTEIIACLKASGIEFNP